MKALTWIVEILNNASDVFYSIYLEVYGWVYPFWLVSPLFHTLSALFSNLAWAMSSFAEWAYDVDARARSILNWDTVWSYILSYIPNLVEIRDWFYNWWGNTWGLVESWWATKQSTVLAWVDEVKQYAAALVAVVNTQLTTLQAAWENFKGMIPTIDEVISWWGTWSGNVLLIINTWWSGALLEVQALIDTAFTTREQFWTGWQDIRQQVLAFFTDPLEFLWTRFTDWFLGPEE